MKLFWMVGAWCLGLASCAAVPPNSEVGPRTLIRNVTVIPMDRRASMPRQDVLVSGDRIIAVATSGSVRAGAADQVIEGSGKYLMPGLWDMHSHALLGGTGPAREALSLYLAHGVVGVRDIGSTLENLSAAKSELEIGTQLPHLVASGPLLDGPKQPWQQKMALPLNTVEEARAAAEKLADAGVDFLKIYNNLSPEQFAAVVEVAARRGLSFAGHVPFKISLEEVSAAGQKSIEHAGLQLIKDCTPEGEKAIAAVLGAWIKNGYPGRYEESSRWWAKRNQAVCMALYSRMAQRQTWVTPTLTNEVQGGRWATPFDLSLLPPDRLRSCESNLESVNSKPASRDAADRDVLNLVRDLHQAGVPLLAGTDTPNSCLAYGSSLHKELELLQHSGLSPWEALKTATANAARFLGRADEGVVRTGAKANLLLLNANPLADVSNTRSIAGVMLGGRWHDGAQLAEMRSLTGGEPTKLYENALVWTGSGFQRRTLAVRGGQFVDPDSVIRAERIDLNGSFIVPAYANAHAHLTNATPHGNWAFLKDGVFYVWNPNTMVLGEKAREFFARKDTFDLALAQGGITEPGGHPEKLYVDVLTKHVYRGKTLKDFLGNAFHYGREKHEIDAALDLLKSQGADFVKAYLLWSEQYSRRRGDPAFYGNKGLNPVNFSYLVTAAHQRGLPVAVHVETAHDLRIAALSGADMAAHLPGYWAVKSEDELQRRILSRADAALIAGSGMLLVPTYAVALEEGVGLAAQADAPTVSPQRVHQMQASNIRLLLGAGARLLIGTDGAGPVYDEAEHLVKIGALTTGEALRMVLETGKYLFPERRIGCFDVGCEADFLVLSADPSREISSLRKITNLVKAGTKLQPPAATAPIP